MFNYIEGFYNKSRIHRTIHNLIPNEFEKTY
ncbi:IS3 family transposase [Mammaliicoccus sciuri]